MYAAQDLRKYAKQGEAIKVVSKQHPTVWIVQNERGVKFPTNPALLCEDKTELVVAEPIQTERKQSTKPLTQAEKLQLEYLNSKK